MTVMRAPALRFVRSLSGFRDFGDDTPGADCQPRTKKEGLPTGRLPPKEHVKAEDSVRKIHCAFLQS